MKKIIHIIIVVFLIIFFSWLYFPNHGFGARGDDSPGYIYLAHKIFHRQPLIYQDNLIKQGIDNFSNIKDVNFLVPTHNTILNNDGWTASKYPIGFSLLLAFVGKIFNNFDQIYLAVPILAVLNLILVYLLSIIIFKEYKYNWLIGLLAALFLGLSRNYWTSAITQPMREIPFITFLLAAFIFAILAMRKSAYYFIPAGLFFGYALNIRETGIILIIPFLILFIKFFNKKQDIRKKIKGIIKPFLLFMIPVILIFSLTLIYSQIISYHTDKDLILPNIEHVKSFSLNHLFISDSRFRQDQGGINTYWRVFNLITYSNLFLLFLFFGVIEFLGFNNKEKSNFKEKRIIFASISLIILLYFLTFSAWINPYPRYILPIFPFVVIIFSLGILSLFKFINDNFSKTKSKYFIYLIIIILLFLNVNLYYKEITDNIPNAIASSRSITRQDLKNLEAIPEKFDTSKNNTLIFAGSNQSGLSELFESHTNIKAIRSPITATNIPPHDELINFFKKQSDKNLFLWLDSRSSSDVNQFFINNFNLEKILDQQYSFMDKVEIYKIKSLK